MLFRAQLPLAATGLVSPDDDRLVLIFESHGSDSLGATSTGGMVEVVRGSLSPRSAPPVSAHDLIVLELGPQADRVIDVLERLRGLPFRFGDALSLPYTVMTAVPASIALEAIRLLSDLGATVDLPPTAPATLDWVRGGTLIPFNEGRRRGPSQTLLTLHDLKRAERPRLRAIFGNSALSYRAPQHPCCGSPMRTVARLMGDDTRRNQSDISLGPAAVHLCLLCNRGILERF